MTLLLCAAAFAAGYSCARLMARRTEKLKARFLSFVSHELNTPITSLHMAAVNLQSGMFGPLPETQVQWIDLIREQAGRMAALVGDLRDLIHLEMHRDFHLNRERIHLQELVEKTLAGMRGALERAAIEIRVNGLKDLPEVDADADRMERVVHALLMHGRKFRLSGPLQLDGHAAGGMVRLELRYTGPKTSPEIVRRSLDLYFPVHDPSSQVLASTGLGLGLARRIAQLHGGRMSADVDPEGRALIRLELPSL
ncbi:MAG: HAMP domain-containing sensor histidine kinase [Elusimicrobiota bacterium]|jgi:signal transduction histidine kinase